LRRKLPNWISAYLDYTEPTEPPQHFHFWVAVSTIAAALQRRVWLDMGYFQWLPNMYIILVAPPGVAKKSSTIDFAMQLLRRVDRVHFGASSITWQALLAGLQEVQETFEWNGENYTQAALHIVASELGMFFDPRNRELIDLLTHLWDGWQGVLKKSTKTMGKEEVYNPVVNILGATTPSWLEQHLSEHFVSGGLASRVLIIYGSKPKHLVAYPKKVFSPEFAQLREALVHDLEIIAAMHGEMEMTPDAIEWGEAWYARHMEKCAMLLETRLGGYFARKQSHIHKLAIVLSAAQSNDRVITKEHLQFAEQMISAVEPSMLRVFDKVGATDVGRLIYELATVVENEGRIKASDAYRHLAKYCTFDDFQKIVASVVKMGVASLRQIGEDIYLIASHKESEEQS